MRRLSKGDEGVLRTLPQGWNNTSLLQSRSPENGTFPLSQPLSSLPDSAISANSTYHMISGLVGAQEGLRRSVEPPQMAFSQQGGSEAGL
jgi:hypothetical protein